MAVIVLKSQRDLSSMDTSHGLLALSGLGLGWWLFSSKEIPRSDPSICHCTCAVKPESGPANNYWILWVAGGLVLALLGANLALALKVTVKGDDSSIRECSLSAKGKPGKGVYGASKGLQLVDR